VKHRADIDGLRGLAVLLVVLYHAGASGFMGGYVGVDVFFTVSGYLLTRLLIDEQQRGGISLGAFYARRARRILPASLAVAAGVLLAGTVLFAPADLRELSGSLIALSTFTSNFYFWRRVDYFESSAPEHPMLHTWSLGLEEQFYLLLPLALLALGRLHWPARFGVLALAAAASLALGVWLTWTHPAAAFYLLPTRGWELLLGGLVALRTPVQRAGLSRGVQWTGLAMIFAAATQFGAQTPFPGIAALLPCLGTAAILWAGTRDPSRTSVLTARPLVAIGLISYSLYLWHWPVLSFARYRLGDELGVAVTSACLGLALVLAWLTWRWVEVPFRERRVLAGDRAWWRSAVASVAVLAACAAGVGAWGGPCRSPELATLEMELDASLSESKSACHLGPRGLARDDQLCVFGDRKQGEQLLLWGDSHANALLPVLQQVVRSRSISVVQATYSGCPPLLDTDIAHSTTDHRCREFNDLVVRTVRERQIKVVVLSAYWAAYAGSPAESRLSRWVDPYSDGSDLGGSDAAGNRRQFELALRRTGQALADMGVRVLLVHQVPVQPVYVPHALIRVRLSGDSSGEGGLPLAAHRAMTADLRQMLTGSIPAARRLDPAEILCKSGRCAWEEDGHPLYIDSHHLSRRGALLLAPLFEREFDDVVHH
jgi:peptidoglycan/LPS O-acetylase OafA/YrhL